MNTTTSADRPAGSCGQATASLVFGIFGFFLPVLASIPAIVLGHFSRARIAKSGGSLNGDGPATVGLVLGYVTLAGGLAFVGLGFAGAQTAINKGKKLKASRMCVTLDQAVLSFYDAYGRLPSIATGGQELPVSTTSSEGIELINILVGSVLGRDENPRQIRFFEAAETKSNRDGIKYAISGNNVEALYDPWGGPYYILLDINNDETLEDPFGRANRLPGRRVVTYTYGMNTVDDEGARDDVKSW